MQLLESPGIDASVLEFADWVELRSLCHPEGLSDVRQDLGSVFRGTEDDPALGSEEDWDETLEARLEDTLFELRRRSEWSGSGYPFVLKETKLRCRNLPLPATTLAYAFCGIVSRIRCLKKEEQAAIPRNGELESLFQACGTVAAAGLVGGESFWFDFPRPDYPKFYEALSAVSARLKDGKSLQQWQEGLPVGPRDGDVDIVAWRHLGDDYPGKLLVLGQCASGMDWEKKHPVAEMKEFLERRYWHAVPASPPILTTLMPFDLRQLADLRSYISPEDAWFGYRCQLGGRFGVILDRFRLARCFARGLAVSRRYGDDLIGGITRLDALRSWILSVANHVWNTR